MEKHSVFTRITTEENNEYICPLEIVQAKGSIQDDDLDDCVEAEVVGRYIGTMEIVDGAT